MEREKKTYRSTRDRARLIQQLTAAYYEPGNLRRCYRAIWQRYIYPVYPMCYNTYLHYLGIDPAPEPRPEEDPRQLTLQF
ncbi:MAG: hypothetical protein E7070_05115 [Bacteroidales bacterium]|nr:hypothetical protein [Bacteroidales bacterium]